MEGISCMSNQLPEGPFKWRTRKGEFVSPCDMQTRHLSSTLLMIWNHSAPPTMSVRPGKKYAFPEFYTTSYMSSAFKAIWDELTTRTDLSLCQYTDMLRLRRLIEQFMYSSNERPILLKELPGRSVDV